MQSKCLTGEFSGNAMIYRKDDWGFPQYSVKLKNQNQKTGEWEYTYMQVSLPKGALVNDRTQIVINKAFFSFYKTANNGDKFKLIITDFDIANQSAGEIDVPTSDTADFDTDLPW